MVASWLREDAWCRRRWDRVGSLMQDSMKASKESSSLLSPLGDVSLPAARWGLSGVVSWASDCARVAGGPRGGASAGAVASA